MGVGHIAATGSAALAVAAVLATDPPWRRLFRPVRGHRSSPFRRRPRWRGSTSTTPSGRGSVIPRSRGGAGAGRVLAVVGMLDAQPVGATAPPVQYRDVVEVGRRQRVQRRQLRGRGQRQGQVRRGRPSGPRGRAPVRHPERHRGALWGPPPEACRDPDGVVQDGDNRVVLTAAGAAGSSVRLRIIAERTALPGPGPPPDHSALVPRQRPGRQRRQRRQRRQLRGPRRRPDPLRRGRGQWTRRGSGRVADRERHRGARLGGRPSGARPDPRGGYPGRRQPRGLERERSSRTARAVTILAVRPEPRCRARRTRTQLRARVASAPTATAPAPRLRRRPSRLTRYALAARPAEGLRACR